MSQRTFGYRWLTALLLLAAMGNLAVDHAWAKAPGQPGGTGKPQSKPQPNQPNLTDKQRAVQEQVAAKMKMVLQKFDVNGNGRLDPAEEQAARAKLNQSLRGGKGKLGSGPQVGAGGQGGGGQFGGQAGGGQIGGQGAPAVNDEQPTGKSKKKVKDPNAKQKLLAEFDADGNGKLDPEEREAARAANAKKKAAKE